MKASTALCALGSILLAGTAVCTAATVYVSTNSLHEVDGVLWGTYVTDDDVSHNAYTNLQQAINAAGI